MSNAKWRPVKVAGLAWIASSTIMVASTASALTGAYWVALPSAVAWFFGLVCFMNLERRGQELRDEAARKLADELMGEPSAPAWLLRAKQMFPTYPNCPGCGQAPADQTIFPEEPGGHFGTCSHKFHDYPWMNNET